MVTQAKCNAVPGFIVAEDISVLKCSSDDTTGSRQPAQNGLKTDL